MASSLRNNPKAKSGKRHDWNSLEDYLWQHECRLDNYVGFVENHKFGYEGFPIDDQWLLHIDMEILCKGGIKLTVNKWAEIKGQRRRKARTVSYSYNASLPVGNILRYDNAHKHPGHSTKHHKHIFNSAGHEIAGSPIPLDEDSWPHMHQVIEELMEMFPLS